jgi:hypothetical protein
MKHPPTRGSECRTISSTHILSRREYKGAGAQRAGPLVLLECCFLSSERTRVYDRVTGTPTFGFDHLKASQSPSRRGEPTELPPSCSKSVIFQTLPEAPGTGASVSMKRTRWLNSSINMWVPVTYPVVLR